MANEATPAKPLTFVRQGYADDAAAGSDVFPTTHTQIVQPQQLTGDTPKCDSTTAIDTLKDISSRLDPTYVEAMAAARTCHCHFIGSVLQLPGIQNCSVPITATGTVRN